MRGKIMTGAPKKPKREKASKPVFNAEPWECRHHADYSELVARVETGGEKKIVAVVPGDDTVSAVTLANFICFVINDYQKRQTVLNCAIGALELLLSEGLTFSAEIEGERALNDIKKAL